MALPEDVGLSTIRSLRSLLQVEPEWEVSGNERALRWWPYRHAQLISATQPVTDGEFSVSRVSVETDVFSLEEDEWDQVAEVLDAQSMFATMSHWGWSDGIVRLRCAMNVHEEVQSFVATLLSVAAIDQAEQAARMGEQMSLVPPAFSGERTSPHPLIGWVEGFRQGSAASAWAGPHIRELARLLTDNGSLSMGDEVRMTVEFPFGRSGGPALAGGDSNLLMVSTEEPHPRLGAGVLIRLHLRQAPIVKKGVLRRATALTAADLNELEWNEQGEAHILGAWCGRPDGAAPVHVSFFPNALADPGALQTLVLSEGLRSRWASSLFG